MIASTIVVVVPAHNASAYLATCLDAIHNSSISIGHVVVADDCSTDDTAQIARSRGAIVVATRVDRPVGPAKARNVAVNVVSADIVVFVDSDVAVHPDTIELLVRPIERAGITASFGSYDSYPLHTDPVSLYGNLRHHYVHQTSRREVTTFWAGCGAVRKAAFDLCGGFDAKYGRPSIEDIEFGLRLSRAGHQIRLVPEAMATHLKRWSFFSHLRSDVFARAIPWSVLLASSGGGLNDLNGQFQFKVSAALSFAVLGAAGWLLYEPAVGVVGLSLVICLWYSLNRGLMVLLLRRGGYLTLVAGTILHLGYYIYSATIYISIVQIYSRLIARHR